MVRTSLVVGLLLGCRIAVAAEDRVVRISAQGVQLPGGQFYADAGFDLLDWNGDGKLDVYLPDPAMTAGSVHLNEGSKTQPKFGCSLWYAQNLTEAEPQTVIGNQLQNLCDLNHDGLFDMIVFDGQLRLIYNTGTTNGPNHWNLALPAPFFPGSPQMIKDNTRYTLAPETMYWGKGVFPRQVLTLTVADWDGDGLEDLLVSRFKGEAPGVQSTGASEQWTPVGLAAISMPTLPPPARTPAFLKPLAQAPDRGLYFYRNTGAKEKPYFDRGVEITAPDGSSLAAPNPVVTDVDGDGIQDLVSTETAYACNTFRVDWPTPPSIVWFKRPVQSDAAHLQPARPVLDAAGKPIPAGVQARVADFRGAGVRDLLVQDPVTGIRWYQNTAQAMADRPVYAPPLALEGEDFARFGFMYQPLVVNWFGPNSRDLILHGCNDAHCQGAYRRTALYKNIATRPGEIKYAFAGYFNYRGNRSLVPQQFPFEDSSCGIYGSYVSLMPDDGSGKKRLMLSVSGQLYLFTNLAADGLTFETCTPMNIPVPNRNRCTGWQTIPVKAPEKVQYIRLSTWGPSLHIVAFEAIGDGTNWATAARGAQVTQTKGAPRNPQAMLTPGNTLSETETNFTSLSVQYWSSRAIVSFKKPVSLEKIRFQLADRDPSWYNTLWPFYWQGEQVRQSLNVGETWYTYNVEVSADQTNWTAVGDRMLNEMMRACPALVDWNGDGKCDLVLGVLNSNVGFPVNKEYRLYLNKGSNDEPKYDDYKPLCGENGAPLILSAYQFNTVGPQCGVAVLDRSGDGKSFDLVVEDAGPQTGLRYYRNVSSNSTELRFAWIKNIGEPVTIEYPVGYRYFYVGDVDGDGTPDLLNNIIFFKGVPAGAPPAVSDLTVTGADKEGLLLRWTRPPGAVRYDLRACASPAVTELDWAVQPSVTGEYTVAEGAAQTARLSLSGGKIVTVVVKSANIHGEMSTLSNGAGAAVPPLKRRVLRNGPAGAWGVPAYGGLQGCWLDAGKPAQPTPRKGGKLEVRTLIPQSVQKQRLILLRFTDLPRLAALEQATLELTSDPQSEKYPLQRMVSWVDVSCCAIRDDWDAATATYGEAAPGKPWAAGELDAGGTFLSKATPLFTVQPSLSLTWDVTRAVREALQAGRTSISLLVRAEYTGKYTGGYGFNFYGIDCPDTERRPRLCLVSTE